jgi:hypothetical protein
MSLTLNNPGWALRFTLKANNSCDHHIDHFFFGVQIRSAKPATFCVATCC